MVVKTENLEFHFTNGKAPKTDERAKFISYLRNILVLTERTSKQSETAQQKPNKLID